MPPTHKATFSESIGRFRARVSASVAHAFALSPQQDALSVEDVDFLNRMAETIVQRGMAAPATLFLESVAPLNFLGSQVMHALTPLLNLACPASEFDRAARLLERRNSIARLVTLIEAKSSVASRR